MSRTRNILSSERLLHRLPLKRPDYFESHIQRDSRVVNLSSTGYGFHAINRYSGRAYTPSRSWDGQQGRPPRSNYQSSFRSGSTEI